MNEAEATHLTKEKYQRFINLVKQKKDETTNVASVHPTYVPNTACTCLITCLNSKWIIDSGATNHICSNLDLFHSYHSFDKEPNTITIADGKSVEVQHIRTVKLENCVMLNKVLHVHGLQFNLISTNGLYTDMNCDIFFSHDKCILQGTSQTGSLVLGKLEDGLYVVGTSTTSKQPTINLATQDGDKLWYPRLAHLPFNKSHPVNSMFSSDNSCHDSICQVCPKAKQTRK